MIKIHAKLYLLLSFLILITFSFSVSSEYLTWKNVKEFSLQHGYEALVVNYYIQSAHKSDVLDKNQFECTDYLTSIWIYLLDFTSEVSLEKLIITSPSNKVEEFFLKEEKPNLNIKKSYVATTLYYSPFSLNEEGIWKIQIETNKTASIYEYDGPIYEFNEKSEVKPIKTIEVLSPSAVQQLRNAKASEKLLEWQKRATFGILFSAIFTAGMAFFTAWMAKATRQTILETKKERKREAMKRVVACVIREEARPLFESRLENILKEITEKKIIEEIGEEPKILFSSPSEPCWKDFKREYPKLFEKIWNTIEKIKDYQTKQRESREKVEEILKEKIKGLSQFPPSQPFEDWFEERYSYLEEWILHNGNYSWDEWIRKPFSSLSGSLGWRPVPPKIDEFTEKLTLEHGKELLKIREEEPLNSMINELVKIAEEIGKNFSSVREEIKNAEEKIMREYDITDYELENINCPERKYLQKGEWITIH
ncbi:MAG: hypothetical protein QXE46_02415 [Candidatus Thermoplasmatota archaeon]